jgi:hypothetical protein
MTLRERRPRLAADPWGAGGDLIGDGLREWKAVDGRPALDPPLQTPQ